MRSRWAVALAAVLVQGLSSTSSLAHHEALFGPQSSLAVESEGFVSLQAPQMIFWVMLCVVTRVPASRTVSM